MNTYLKHVKEFHEVMDHPIGNENELELLEVRQLRIKLLFEELEELAEASDCKATFLKLCNDGIWENTNCELPVNNVELSGIKDGDNVNIIGELDALCDLQYVLSGKILTAGYHEVFDEAFDLVHESNMSKVCESQEQAEETIDHLVMGDPTLQGKLMMERNKGYWIVKRNDGKIMKSKYYKPVILHNLLSLKGFL